MLSAAADVYNIVQLNKEAHGRQLTRDGPAPPQLQQVQQQHHAELTNKLAARPALLHLWHYCCSELPQETRLETWKTFLSM